MLNFDIKFDSPTHGWLPVEIFIGQESYELAASNILNDPVDELLDGMLRVLNFSDKAVIHWWLEAVSWTSLELNPNLKSNSLEIILYCEHYQEDLSSARKIFKTVAPKIKVCRCIASSLRNLIYHVGQSDYEHPQAWNRKFPAHKIDKVYSVIREKKG